MILDYDNSQKNVCLVSCLSKGAERCNILVPTGILGFRDPEALVTRHIKVVDVDNKIKIKSETH